MFLIRVMRIAEDGSLLWAKVIGDATTGAVCSKAALRRNESAIYFTGKAWGFGNVDQKMLYWLLGICSAF